MRTDRSIAAVFVALVLTGAGVGCQEQSAAPVSTLPTTSMKLGNKTFTLEIAATEEDRERGLMRRDSMPADHGMIFVFGEPIVLQFYMKNTRIPLDIVFVGPDQKVVSIKQMKAYDLSTTSSDYKAKWAIELNKGAASDAGLKVGDQLDVPPAAREPKD
jgi:uncharacterized membrane protein (UPF0127 family)